jgi:fumarylacetoacetase
MTAVLDRTHDPAARSWVASANRPGTPFPIQNQPLGVFRRAGGTPRIGIAIGDEVLDLSALAGSGPLGTMPAAVLEAIRAPVLNPLMALGRPALRVLRQRVFELLLDGCSEAALVGEALVPGAEVALSLPALVGDYTDFYASIHHARNVGRMFRPDQPLLPNYAWVPIGYHGRASSLVVSGVPVRRPSGQVMDDGASAPGVGPTRLLDYECEVGAWIAGENALGDTVSITDAEERVFGLCLVNDWSARDVQKWEYQPLGPFLAKSFATSVSPWVVTMEALAPFRVAPAARDDGMPGPLPYLDSPANRDHGGVALDLDVLLASEQMRREGIAPVRLSQCNLSSLYWTVAQLLTHHASNGCNLRPGDLLASGTVSGPEPDALGCLLELTQRGTRPVTLPTGEVRRFLADGDEVILRGTCAREGYASIGLGECRAVILPARGPGPTG